MLALLVAARFADSDCFIATLSIPQRQLGIIIVMWCRQSPCHLSSSGAPILFENDRLGRPPMTIRRSR